MKTGALGKVYPDGEAIVRQGEAGECMYVIQEGEVEVLVGNDGREVPIAILGKNDFFGEMSIFDHEVRSATVRAVDDARILTVDKKNFFRAIQEDPTLAFRLVATMSRRIRRLTTDVVRSRTEDRRQNVRATVYADIAVKRQDKAIKGKLRNASVSGVLIKVNETLGAGEELIVRLPRIRQDIVASVVRETDSGDYALQFGEPLLRVLEGAD